MPMGKAERKWLLCLSRIWSQVALIFVDGTDVIYSFIPIANLGKNVEM